MTALISKTAQQGTFAAGEKFVEWLAKTKQSAWQILPLHQTQLQKGSKTKHVSSPYKGYGIGLDPRFLQSEASAPNDKELKDFVKENNYWLETYTLFCALRDHFGTDAWTQWPSGIRRRKESELKKWQKKLAPEINNHLLVQARLHLAYQQLQMKAKEAGVILIGDMPFYLGLNSPLVWMYQELFEIESSGKLLRVSGVLYGVKSHFGRQIWGHPLYRWQEKNLRGELYGLFRIRVRYLASLFDWIRLDHTKGLFSYGSIGLDNHKLDTYQIGPGQNFLERLIKYARLRKLKIYAEDTGDNLKELRNCLHKHHLPGVKIFRFGYNEKIKSYSDQYLNIALYPINTFAYTTTHDTETLMKYLELLSPTEIKALTNKLQVKQLPSLRHLAKLIRDEVIHSPAKFVIIPLQDWLLSTDRINTPGTEREIDDPNWQYRMSVMIEDLPVNV